MSINPSTLLSPSFRRYAPAILAAGVAFLVFLPSLGADFLRWDDDHNLLLNPHFRGFSMESLRWMWSTALGGLYLPLTWMSFALDHHLYGLHPAGYHLTNVLWHSANVYLFYGIARTLLSRAWEKSDGFLLTAAAVWSAAAWGLHPMRVESVTWITERRDVLSLFFALGATRLHWASLEGPGRWGRRIGAAVLFACALLAKPSVLVFPALWLAADVYPFRRWHPRQGIRRAGILLWEKVPYFFLSALAAGGLVWASRVSGGRLDWVEFGWDGRLAQTSYGVLFYLGKFLWPSSLSPVYEYPAGFGQLGFFIQWGGLAGGVTLAAVLLRRRFPGFSAAWAVHLIALAPVLGLFQRGPQVAADRYSYFSSFGWILCVAGLLFPLGGTTALARRVSGLAAGTLLVGWALLTIRYQAMWQSTVSLWEHVLTNTPRSFLAHYNLGVEWLFQNRPGEAVEHLRRAALVHPDSADVQTNLGMAYASVGRFWQARHHLALGEALSPENVRVIYASGNVELWSGNRREAERRYRDVVGLDPDFAPAYNRLGEIRLSEGQTDAAAAFFREALVRNPGLSIAQENLNRLGAGARP